jgi:TANFOR domain-containing protein
LKHRLTILSFLLFIIIKSGAQVFPVQATTQLSPPYSLYLADYVESGAERLALNVFLTDPGRPELNVRFRFRIVGQGITIETRPDFIPPPITIQGGVPLRLISTDLADYFNPNTLNFQGITRREYEKTGKLPEGVYQFCFEVLEYNRGAKISNTACAIAWMVLNDPPIINIPQQNEKLKPQLPQNVVFQWTPRHTGSPNSAFTTEYEIKMVEVWPATRNPNDAILTSPPILETTTRNTSFVYGPAETPLEPGRRYAFRIQAKSIAGVEELDLFKNNGYSEVFSFVYGDACNFPSNINAEALGSQRFSLQWDTEFNHTAFTIKYRPVGTTQWYESSSSFNESIISSLKPVTTYEYQVAARCGFFDGVYSPIGKVTTLEEPLQSYSCGVPLETFNLDAAELTGSLKVGDVIKAGDFNVTLTKVTGSNGVFSGEGVITVAYFNRAKVKAEFTNISVNKDLRLVNGFFNVTGAGVEIIPGSVMNLMDDLTQALDLADSALTDFEQSLPGQFDPHSFVADTLVTSAGEITKVYKAEDGSVVIEKSNGTQQTLPSGGGETYAIKDDKGNAYLVDKNGKVHKTSADVATKAANREYNLTLKFTEDPLAKNGFDKKKHDALTNDYEVLENGYDVPWKAVESNATDPVLATVEGTNIDKNKIRFEIGGAVVQAPPVGSTQSTSVIIPGKTDEFVEDLIALYTPDDKSKDQVLGKLKVVSYDKITKEVVLVPVNGAKYPGDISVLTNSLNKIYGQAVVQWSVRQDTEIKVSVGDPFDDGQSGLLSNYTSDMKAVINAYKASMQRDVYYLFLVNNPQTPTALGYMPRNKQSGFIFIDNHGNNYDKLTQTIAHELGHGVFNLQHTFKEFPALTEGSTDNLMDYSNGTKLYKYQWGKMRHSDIVIGLFEEDEDAEALLNLQLTEFDSEADTELITGTVTTDCQGARFISQENKLIDLGALKDQIVTYFFKNEKLVAFKDKNNRTFKYSSIVNTEEIKGALSDVKRKIVSKDEEVLFVCYECIQNDKTIVAEKVQKYNSTETTIIYKKVPEIYKAKIKDVISCAVGNVVVTDYNAATKVFSCKVITEEDCKKLSTGSGEGSGNLFNFAKEELDEAFIKKLFSGADVKFSGKNKDIAHHTLKAILFITNAATIDANKKFIEDYKVPQGYVKLWIHKGDKGWEIRSQLPETVKGIFGLKSIEEAFGVKCPSTGADGKSIYSMEDFNSPLQAAFSSVDYIATAYYELFDALAKGIRSARIPDYAWNCDDTEKYKPVYAYVYKYLTLPLNPLKALLLGVGGEHLAKAVQHDNPQLAEVLRNVSNGNAEFAFLCGVWNGLVETLASVPEIGKYIYGVLSCEGRKDFGKFWDQLSRFEKEDDLGNLECKGTWCAIKTGLAKQFSGTCQIAEMGGEVVFVIVASFIDPAASEALFGKGVSFAIKVIQYCDAFADKFNPATWALRFTANGVKILRKETNKVFGRLIDGDLVAKTVDGQSIRVPMNKVVLEEGIDGGLLARVTENGKETVHKLSDDAFAVVDVLDESLQKAEEELKQQIKKLTATLNANPFANPEFIVAFSKYASLYIGKGVRDFTVFVAKLPVDIKKVVNDHLDSARKQFDEIKNSAVDVTKIQKIGDKYPINAEDFAGKTFSFDLSQNPTLAQRLDTDKKLTVAELAARKAELEKLHIKYPKGIRFTETGFPDFYPYVIKDKHGKPVEMDIETLNPDPIGGGTKGSQLDMNEANRRMKAIDPEWRQPDKTTWHHVENSTKLVLVPTDLHSAVRHTGGRSTYFKDSAIPIDSE